MRTAYLPEPYPAYTAGEKDPEPQQGFVSKPGRSKHKRVYSRSICTFDIETTTITHADDPAEGFMYHWQMCIDGIAYYGRTWEEWIALLRKIQSAVFGEDAPEGFYIAVWVHNLGYEFQFMQNFLRREFGDLEIFAIKARVPVRVNCGTFEFRCSWKLSNMSLEKACQNEKGATYYKMSGDLDYKKLRTPETYLDDKEFSYCIGDVVSLWDFIRCRLANDKDTIASIPMTSTGYIRRQCRRRASKDKNARKEYQRQYMTPEVYKMLLECGRGGDTHANRYRAGRIWYGVDSYDLVSSYPFALMSGRYPVTGFGLHQETATVQEIQELMNDNLALIFRIAFEHLECKASTLSPYIPLDKSRFVTEYVNDNGRILSAETLAITITDIDWTIIRETYTWDNCYITDVFSAEYGQSQQFIRDEIMELFGEKCELKEAIKHTEGEVKANNEYLYVKCKNRLNGIFGMCYTKPVRDTITYDSDGWHTEKPDFEEALDKAQKSRSAFLVYAHGVWTTAIARRNLYELQLAFGEGFIYSDTDSVKGIPDAGTADRIAEYNAKRIAQGISYTSKSGSVYYLGIAECETEKERYAEFKTLGAKKYCYTDSGGLHVTISGVNKKEAKKELKTIDNFVPGFTFRESAGSAVWYNDKPDIYTINVDGCDITTSSNIGMLDTTYLIGITGDYNRLLTNCQNMSIIEIDQEGQQSQAQQVVPQRKGD